MSTPELKRILHVEDEPDIQTVTRMAMELLGGFTVQSCDDGIAAVACAAKFKPDLLLLDVMLPGMDGKATLKALRNVEGLGKVPAIFMTAKAQTHEINGLVAEGAIAVITKPFDPMTLVDQIKSAWQKFIEQQST